MKNFKLLFLLFFISNVFAQNSLKVKDLNAGPGDKAQLVLDLDNVDPIAGLQFTLKFPSDILVKQTEVKFVGRNADHIIYPKALGNGEFLFLIFSASNATFTGNSGGLLEIPVEIPLSYVPGQNYPIVLSEVVISTSSGVAAGSTPVNGTFHVTEGKNPDLKVDTILFSDADVLPNSKFDLSWQIHNIGKSSAVGGWSEQIALVSQVNGKKYIIGNTTYAAAVPENQYVDRTAQLDIPAIIGFDGPVKIEVVVTPNAAVKEPASFKANNTAVSSSNANLLKRLLLTLDRQEIIESTTDPIRVKLARSGDLNTEESFTLTSDIDAFGLPVSLKIKQNESAAFAYIKPNNNTTYEGTRNVVFKIQGNGYNDETAAITLLDDEKIILSLSYPNDYNSVVGSTIPFTLTANFPNTKEEVVTISTDKSQRLQVPSQVTIPLGATTVNFEGTILNTQLVEKAEIATLFAKATGYTSAGTGISLGSINVPQFTLSFSASKVSEGDGTRVTYLTVKRTTHIDKEAIVSLSASQANQLILPPSDLYFKKGESEKVMVIGAIDNATVDGERLITLNARVKFSSCNCTDTNDATTLSQAAITIIDNDGLALTVLPSPSSLKAGSSNNTLKISRNVNDPGVLANPLVVDLTSNLPSVINLPATATIPSGSKEVLVTYSTVIDHALSGDQNPRIEASASGYANGYGWILVTDQNKSDILIDHIIAPTNIESGKYSIRTFIKNQGNAVFTSGATVNYYISKTNDISNLAPFASSVLNKAVAVGQTFEYVEEVQLPNTFGDFKLIVLVNGEKSINELDYTNNQGLTALKMVTPYTASVATDKSVYLRNEEVKISGTAKNSSNSSMPLVAVELKIVNQGFQRKFLTKTDANGNYEYVFQPLQNEVGTYQLTAAYPGEVVPSQATFQILGFELIGKPQFIKWEPLVNVPLQKEFTLKNNTGTTLTGVQINLPAFVNFTIEQTPITIAPGQTATLPYTIKATVASEEVKYYKTPFSIVSNEGAELNENAYYYSKNQEPIRDATLEVNPVSINTTMIKDQSRSYEFSIKNTGAVDAENVEVRLPEMGWLTLKSSAVIPIIKAFEEAKVVLELKPTAKEQINAPISGTFVIKQKYGAPVRIPFRVETVSESTGTLVVDATDEYTFNTASAPHLKGAKVVVKHPFTGVVIAEGVTNDSGLFEVPSIKEGWYTIDISAEKHNPYQNNIQVDPGRDTRVSAFLPYQAISYSWDVTKVEIKDEYDVVLVSKFETNVPKPVVVMEIDNPKLDLQVGESRVTYITITNHGLIAANRVKISIGEDVGGYTFTPLIASLDILEAKSSLIVPVLVKNESGIGSKGVITPYSAEGGGCSIPVTFSAYYPCGDRDEPIFSFNFYTQSCPSLPTLPKEPERPTLPIDIDLSEHPDCANFLNDSRCWPVVTAGQVGEPPYPPCINGVGCGGGGGGNCSDGCDPGGTSSSITNNLNICDPCPNAIISALYEAVPGLDEVGCIFDLVTSQSLVSIGVEIAACFISKLSIANTVCNLKNCLPNSSGKSCADEISDFINYQFSFDPNQSPLDHIFDVFNQISLTEKAQFFLISEYVKNPALEMDKGSLGLFLQTVGPFLDENRAITPADVVSIKERLSNVPISPNYIDDFVTRWNTTVIAWNKNVLSPNPQFPSIMDKNKIDGYKKIKNDLQNYALKRGFVSVEDMYQNAYEVMEDFQEEKESSSSACASVSIEFPQKISMAREAFEGTLKINNSSDKMLKNINLELVVKNEIGENKTHLFKINKEAFLSGTGTVAAQTNGIGLVTFIPTKEAAPQIKQSYSFGGTLSYFDTELNETVYIDLNPVTLEVDPSPDLVLHYFMQRDILGDDALTEDVVESSIPAELSLMISNEGYGLARKVAIESMQPKIVDNEKGLLVDFKMIGSNFNNKPKELGLLNIDFGSIEPQKAAIGQWWFTSSLLGHFVAYDVQVKHISNYGNANLSLIKAAYVHEFIKSVKAYGTDSDAISDFLVNDIADTKDTPDRIYISDGSSEEVKKAQSIEASNAIASGNFTATLTLSPEATGWNYANILDPGGNQYKLVKVVRDNDNFEIPIQNAWQTHVTLKDGLNPKYENKLHILDKIAAVQTYTLYYNPIDGNIPAVATFVDAPQNNNASPVELVKVRFNKDIDANSFTIANIALIHQGVKVPSDAILIGKIDNSTYSLNIKEVTKQSGYYELTVSALGVKDLLGNEGKEGKKIGWTQFVNKLGILRFESDQVKKQPVNTVTVTFNKPIRSEEFTVDKIKIGEAIANGLTIQKIDEYVYTISGINSYTNLNGNYKLEIDVTKITAVDGTKGIVAQTFEWTVDKELPSVTLLPNNQGGTSNQNITEIDIVLNKKVVTDLNASAFIVTKNGQPLVIPILVQKIDHLNYKLLGLGEYTKTNGDYRLVLDQTKLVDENENSGQGIAEAIWSVRIVNFNGVAGLKVTPDRGVSNTDNSTSGNDVELFYTTLQDNLKVEIYEALSNLEVLLYKHDRAVKGDYKVSLSNKFGAKKFKVVAYDTDGNQSNAAVLNSFIDFKDIVVAVNSIKTSSDVCSGFDYVTVNFGEEIQDGTFNKDAFEIQLSGTTISNANVNVIKIDNSNYKIEGITYPSVGELELKIDKSKLSKKSTGMKGMGTYSKTIGNPNKYAVVIAGEEEPETESPYVYTATESMDKYDWIVVNGKIVSSSNNAVTVKWNKTGEQYLVVRYKTPLGCTTTAEILVDVKECTFSNGLFFRPESENTMDSIANDGSLNENYRTENNTIYPVPNDGSFTIQVSNPLKNCTLDIYNVSGTRVHQERNVDFSTTLKKVNAVGLPNGVYLIKINSEEQSLEFKFIKQ